MKNLFLVIGILALSSCSSVVYKRSDVLSRQNNIAELEQLVKEARAKDVDSLAPDAFDSALAILMESISQAQKSKDEDAGDDYAAAGLEKIARASELAEHSRYILADALAKRLAAQEVLAHNFFEAEFIALEKSLKAAGRAIEHGNDKFGIEQNVVIAKGYGELESKAMQISVGEKAEVAYKQAVAAGAEKLAPKTMKNAKSELEVARRIVGIEKENYEKAQYHADRATFLSMQAKSIAETVTAFSKEKLSYEDIVLWYQQQLETIHEPLEGSLPLNLPNREMVAAFTAKIKEKQAYNDELEERLFKAEKDAAALTEKIAGMINERDKLKFEIKAHEEKYNSISNLFAKDEAEILRRGNDIIIRSYGFTFPVGKSELLSSNFSLLNKIVSALIKFPKSAIEVEGHTDSTGSNALNMKLSKDRAQNIADFLVKVANIDSSRVTSVGLGASRPIAPNDSPEGRAKNRRIEVIIKNK